MSPTQYPDINNLLHIILSQIQNVLGEKLIGLYLYGSLVTGDFDSQASDIDLVAALESSLNDEEFKALEKMHQDFASEHKEWEDRIEVQYMSKLALKTFKTEETEIAVISPGEPFYKRVVGKHWLMNWYIVRENGKTYAQIAEEIMPSVLIEDDCESIGREKEMTYPHINPELKNKIKSIIVKEFEGIDHLPDDIQELV